MAEADESLERWILGLRDGDPVVLGEFMSSYRPALERIAARRIEPRLARRTSAESVAQSVCRTFLRRAGAGRFDLGDGDALWRLLCAMTLNKVRERRRFHRRQKRDVTRETAIEASPEGVFARASDAPDELAAFDDTLSQLLEEFSDEERLVFELRLRDLGQAAIADEVGCSERTVRRVLGRLEVRMRAALEDA